MPQPQQWTNVSRHAVSLAAGPVLAPGEHAPCDMKHPADQANRDTGLLVPRETGKETSR